MEKGKQEFSDPTSALSEDGHAFMAATAGVAKEKIRYARKRLGAALASGKTLYGDVRDKAFDGAKAADQALRERPYEVIGIALGVGALIGYLFARRCSRNGK